MSPNTRNVAGENDYSETWYVEPAVFTRVEWTLKEAWSFPDKEGNG